jgi:hypothetical protein
MNFLAKAIATTMAGALYSTAGHAQETQLPEIVVTAPVYYPDTIFLGPLYSSSLWSWPDTGLGDIANYNAPFTPEICDLLATTGRPQDCTRSVVSDFEGQVFVFPGTVVRIWPNRPTLPPFDEWSTARLTEAQANQFAVVQINAENQLVGCYTDPSEEPEACEREYVEALDVCDQSWVTSNASMLSACNDALEMANARIDNANFDRSVVEWIDFAFVRERYGLEVNINIPFDRFYLNLNPHNKLYVWLRRGDACQKWFKTWDGKSCSDYYQGVA